jgi:glycolate oxidase FAD binding subunit
MAAMSQTIAPTPSPSAHRPLAPAVADWIEQIQLARREQRRLHIQGSGTKAFLGTAAAGADRLDTRTHRGIVAYEPTELVLTARAGTPLTEIEAALAEHGQHLAFEPPRFGPATIGGVVAAGLSGPARASVGAVRDFVLGVHLVNGRGEYLEFGGQVMKNVAGYDVSRLLAGSLGTLGVMAQVSLKVLPVPPADATLRFDMPQAEALQHLARWRGQPLPLQASLWQASPSDAPHEPGLYLRLRGARAAVESACERLLREAGGQRHESWDGWERCREQTLDFFAHPASAQWALWRLSVAPTHPPLDLPWPTLIEWHGGLRWVWAPEAESAALQSLAERAGGHATLFRPPATGAADLPRHAPLPRPLYTLHQRLKTAFDPDHVFTPLPWTAQA